MTDYALTKAIDRLLDKQREAERVGKEAARAELAAQIFGESSVDDFSTVQGTFIRRTEGTDGAVALYKVYVQTENGNEYEAYSATAICDESGVQKYAIAKWQELVLEVSMAKLKAKADSLEG